MVQICKKVLVSIAYPPFLKYQDIFDNMEFHAWMLAQNLTEESHFEILSIFTAHLAGILKDWWTSIEDADKMTFLTRQDFISWKIFIFYI